MFLNKSVSLNPTFMKCHLEPPIPSPPNIINTTITHAEPQPMPPNGLPNGNSASSSALPAAETEATPSIYNASTLASIRASLSTLHINLSAAAAADLTTMGPSGHHETTGAWTGGSVTVSVDCSVFRAGA